MRRVLALVGVVAIVGSGALSATSCGVIADDNAAVIGNTGVPASLVDSLARSEAFSQLLGFQAASGESVLPGSTARSALGFVLEAEVLFAEAERQGLEVTADEELLAEQISGAGTDPDTGEAVGVDDFAPRVRDYLARYVAASDVLVNEGEQPDPLTDDDLRLVYDRTPDLWDQTCLTLVAVPDDLRGDVEEALAGGAGLAGLADAVDGAQVVADAEEACTARASLEGSLPADLLDRVAGAAEGERVGPIVLELQQGPVVVWFEVESRGVLPFEEARADLEGLAEQSRTAVIIARDTVVNPRYGSGIELEVQTAQQGSPRLVATVGAPQTPEPESTPFAPAGAAGATP